MTTEWSQKGSFHFPERITPFEEAFGLFLELACLWEVVRRQGRGKGFHRFALSAAEVLRHFNLYAHMEIAATALQAGHALIAQAENFSSRSSGGQFQTRIPFGGWHVDVSAQSRKCRRDVYVTRQIIAMALKHFMITDMEYDIEVAMFTAACTAFAFSGESQPRTRLNALRDLECDMTRCFYTASSLAFPARIFNDTAFTVTNEVSFDL